MIPALLLALGDPAPSVQFDFRQYPIGAIGEEHRAVDMDGDGLLDLVIAQEEVKFVTVLLQTAPREFGSPTGTPVTVRPNELTVADVDGDGDLDVVVGSNASGRLQVLRNDGLGGLTPLDPLPLNGIGETQDLVSLDVDGDGAAESIVSVLNETELDPESPGSLLLVRHVHGPSEPALVEYALDDAPHQMAIGDPDGDGRDELVHARFFNNGFLVWEPMSDGTLAMGPVLGTGDEGEWGRLDDVDGDGQDDLIEDWKNSHWAWTTEDYPSITTLFLVNFGGRGAYADFDGDGDADQLIVGSNGSPSTQFRLSLLENPATWSYTPFQLLENVGKWDGAQGIADLDADGRPDVFSVADTTARIEISWNDGPPPAIDSFEPSPVPALLAPGEVLRIRGSCLDQVTAGTLGGFPLAFDGACDDADLAGCVTTVDSETLEIVVPPLVGASGGTLPLVLEHATGTLTVDLPTTLVAAPTLLNYDADGSLAAGAPTALHTAGPADGIRFLLTSPDLVPSELPALLELEIGSSFTTLFVLATGLLDADGLAVDPLVVPASAAGLVLHFEAVAIDPQALAGPYATSNVVSLVLGG